MEQPYNQLKSETLPNVLEITPDEIFSDIFIMLDVKSIGAVVIACKRFKSIIYESNKRLIIYYIISSRTTALDQKLVRGFVYLLEFQLRNSGLLLWPRFKPVDPEREIESSSGYSINVLLWVEEGRVTDKESLSLRWFISKISKYPQTPIILLLKGDSIFFWDKELLQKVRELCSLKVLGVINGSPQCWSNLDSFNGLELVYFAPKKQYRRDNESSISIISTTIWTISTKETTFIMNSTDIMIIYSDNLV
jgi:hypothetical protein